MCEELLAAAEARRATAGIEAVLSVAYVEVFGSEVIVSIASVSIAIASIAIVSTSRSSAPR